MLFKNHQISTDSSILFCADITNLFLLLLLPLQCVSDPGAVFLRLPLGYYPGLRLRLEQRQPAGSPKASLYGCAVSSPGLLEVGAVLYCRIYIILPT